MLKVLERALDSARRQQLMAAAKKSSADLFEACEFVLMLPRGTGIQGVKKDCDGYRKRWRRLCILLEPSKAQMFPRLVFLPQFAEALQNVNAAWQELEVLLQKSEGTYQPTACALHNLNPHAMSCKGTPRCTWVPRRLAHSPLELSTWFLYVQE
mgnify:CR=1 FL=1